MTAHANNAIILHGATDAHRELLTVEALEFVASLQRRFDETRRALLADRPRRRALVAKTQPRDLFDFPSETADVRASEWSVAPAPADLNDRRVEITGPVDTKMMINALNSGARVFMADLEDSCSPT